MIIPCEVAVKSVVPAVKALMAQALVEKHGLKQGQAAELLGISQSAVSKYTHRIRGCIIKIGDVEEVQVHIESMVTLITNGGYEKADLLRLFCQTCEAIRGKGLMCECCKRASPGLVISECRLCFSSNEEKPVGNSKKKLRR